MEGRSERGNSRLLLILVVISSFINPFMGASVNIALPAIADEFSLNAVGMGWVAMSFLLSSAVFLVPFGKIADISGRIKMFLTGNIILVISNLLGAFAYSGIILILFRLLQGIGSAMVFGTSTAIVTAAFPPGKRGRVIGITVTSVYLGLSLAPVLGGFLTEWLGWRSLFLFPVPFGIFIVLTLLFFVRPEVRSSGKEKFDTPGAILYVVAMTCAMYGFSGIPAPVAVALMIAGMLGLVIFVMLQRKSAFPVFDVNLLYRNRLFAFSNFAALINYATTYAVTFLLSLYLQYIKALSPREAGLLLVTQPALMAMVAAFSGRLSDVYDARWLSSGGMGLVMTGLVMLIFVGPSTENGYLIACLCVLGTGFGLFSSPNTNSVMSSVERSQLGIASATIGTMRLTGQMISMGVATLVLHLFVHNERISSANNHLLLQSMRVIFLIFALLTVAGILASLARGKKKDMVG